MAVVAASPAEASVRIGADTSLVPSGQTGCGASACTLVFESVAPGFAYVAPANGVIVRWSILTGTGTAQWRLRTVKKTASDFAGVRSGPFESVVPDAPRTFPARIPMSAGESIGLDGPPSATASLRFVSAAASMRQLHPQLADGGAPQTPNVNGGGFAGLFSAELEADADHDEFGDESQDACPADATRHQQCVTFLKAPKLKVKTKKKKAKARFEFTAGSSAFQCKLDAAAFSACVSPMVFKVKRGRHTFEVRAVNASGYVDPAPSAFTWKVKRKKSS